MILPVPIPIIDALKGSLFPTYKPWVKLSPKAMIEWFLDKLFNCMEYIPPINPYPTNHR